MNSSSPQQHTSGLAIASLVFGILSCTLLGFVAGIPAVICGHAVRRQAFTARSGIRGTGIAVAGLVLGYVGIAVSGILLIAVIFNTKSSADRSRITRATSDMQSLATQLKVYDAVNDRYPTDEQGLRALVEKPTISPVPKIWYQLYREVPKDPWGHAYVYRTTSGGLLYTLYSAGPDGVADTADDIKWY